MRAIGVHEDDHVSVGRAGCDPGADGVTEGVRRTAANGCGSEGGEFVHVFLGGPSPHDSQDGRLESVDPAEDLPSLREQFAEIRQLVVRGHNDGEPEWLGHVRTIAVARVVMDRLFIAVVVEEDMS
jgi:hypothetical protein